MINDPAQLSQARQPRGLVKISASDANGNTVASETMPGWIDWSVDNNTFSHADTFGMNFAVSALPSDRGADWWAQQNQITAEIYAGFPANPENFTADELALLIVGNADSMEFDPIGRIIALHGRDLTSLMIDAQTVEKWQNKKASEVAQTIAARHGLNFVGQATTTRLGTYYQLEQASLTAQRSEWDMLSWLAGLEGFVVYVSGRDLHFEPAPDAGSDPYVIQWQQVDGGRFDANALHLGFTRNMALSKGIKVVVESFNQRTGKVSKSYPKAARKDAQVYTRRFANLNNEQALQKAQAIYQEIIAHEIRLEALLPADNLLQRTSIIRVQGMGLAYDQLYYPESITRTMSMDEGYRMKIHAKNHSPENSVQ